MTESNEQLTKIIRMIDSAESSLKSAKALLAQLAPDAVSQTSHASGGKIDSEGATTYEEGDSQIVEGYFDGQNMIGPNDKIYPVPANYASKSKLVEGDKLKLTIQPNGSFLYKQIAPVPREFVKGALLSEDGQYRVIADGKIYRVLLASVTYYKGTVGDEVTLVVPKDKDSTWGTIEAVIPQVSTGNYSSAESF